MNDPRELAKANEKKLNDVVETGDPTKPHTQDDSGPIGDAPPPPPNPPKK